MGTKAIGHYLVVYNGATEELESLNEITKFDLEAFKLQFDITEAYDPKMFNKYAIGPDDLEFLGRYISPLPDFDFQHMGYFIEALEKDANG